MRISGTYTIKNTKNGKFYVGGAVNLHRRWSYHKWQLNANVHTNPILQRAWNKYGSDAFTFKVRRYCERNEVGNLEQVLLDRCVGNPNCYNIAFDARAPMTGRKQKKSTKQKIGDANRGRKQPPISEATRWKLKKNNSRYWKGKHRDAKTRKKLSIACGGVNSPKAKLTEKQVLEIRKSALSRSVLGQKYGVDKTTIDSVRERKSYKHVR